MNVMTVFLELVIGYIALFTSAKLLGKTQISQITPFDFVSALVLGELVGNAVYQDDIGLKHIFFGVAVWGGLIFSTEFLTQKSLWLRTIFEGRPSIIIHRGQLDWKELKKNHLDVDQLMQLLRTKDVFSLYEVEYAILENNGTISILKNPSNAAPTRQDFDLPNQNISLPCILISDGEVRYQVLRQYGLNEAWLQQQLKSQGIKSIREVCIAEWNGENPLYIQKFQKN